MGDIGSVCWRGGLPAQTGEALLQLLHPPRIHIQPNLRRNRRESWLLVRPVIQAAWLGPSSTNPLSSRR
jgi:hypothetical protein